MGCFCRPAAVDATKLLRFLILSLYSVGENWTKKDVSCYAAFLSYFSSLEVRYYETILIPNEV